MFYCIMFNFSRINLFISKLFLNFSKLLERNEWKKNDWNAMNAAWRDNFFFKVSLFFLLTSSCRSFLRQNLLFALFWKLSKYCKLVMVCSLVNLCDNCRIFQFLGSTKPSLAFTFCLYSGEKLPFSNKRFIDSYKTDRDRLRCIWDYYNIKFLIYPGLFSYTVSVIKTTYTSKLA
jgi:hypothetical protein